MYTLHKKILSFINNKVFHILPKPPKNKKELKEFTGEFKYVNIPNGFVRIIGDWEKENIVELQLPIKDSKGNYWNIKCNKRIKYLLSLLFLEYNKLGYEKTYPITQLGCFVPRHKMSNPNRSLSIHAYGIAVDINWKTNGVNKIGDIPTYVVKLFEQYGFSWGGNWKTRDPMHFEFYSQ